MKHKHKDTLKKIRNKTRKKKKETAKNQLKKKNWENQQPFTNAWVRSNTNVIQSKNHLQKTWNTNKVDCQISQFIHNKVVIFFSK